MNTKILRPLGSNIVIKRDIPEETTAGGIIIPEKAKDKPGQGTVIAVGNGKTLDSGVLVPPSVKVGDTVLFNKWASEYEVAGEKFAVLKEEEILAVIESETAAVRVLLDGKPIAEASAPTSCVLNIPPGASLLMEGGGGSGGSGSSDPA